MMALVDLDIFDGKVKFAFQAFIPEELWNGKVIFAFQAFIREEFMELVEDLGAEVNKYS